jgi:hypothetical protein
MRKRAKSLFCSVLFNEYHHRTKLIALLFRDFVFEKLLSTRNYKTSPKKIIFPYWKNPAAVKLSNNSTAAVKYLSAAVKLFEKFICTHGKNQEYHPWM